MFCKYMGSLFTKARGRDDRRFQTIKRDVARTLLLFRRTILASSKPSRSARTVSLRSSAKSVGIAGEADPERYVAARLTPVPIRETSIA